MEDTALVMELLSRSFARPILAGAKRLEVSTRPDIVIALIKY